MNNLRHGLVEAMAEAMEGESMPHNASLLRRRTVASENLDAALDFLTDYADQWFVSAGGMVLHGVAEGSTSGPNPTVAGLIAALRAEH